MEQMEILKFKTNINCSGCVAKVTPALNSEAGIKQWRVDTQHPDKILSVQADNLSAEKIADLVRKSGFTISPINS